MDATPNVLAETVRAKRMAIDNDLETLRVRLKQADPRRRIDGRRLARTVLPAVAGVGAVWLWARRKRAVTSLDRLLVHLLGELQAMERELVPLLAKYREFASDPDLQALIDAHRGETETHVERLTRVFRAIDAKPVRGTSQVVAAIAAGGDRVLGRKVDPDVRDAWLIATAQRIEHDEIAGYGTARTYADTLGYARAADLLQETLEEERAADAKLTLLAERFVNCRAVAP
jgi:ferritin-like metal-binding protein YciE